MPNIPYELERKVELNKTTCPNQRRFVDVKVFNLGTEFHAIPNLPVIGGYNGPPFLGVGETKQEAIDDLIEVIGICY